MYDISIIVENFWNSAPVAVLCLFATIAMVVGAFAPKSVKIGVPAIGIVGIGVSAWFAIYAIYKTNGPVGMQVMDEFTVVFDLIVLGTTAVGILVAAPYIVREGLVRSEYYALLMFSAAGAMLMAASDDLVMMWLGLELLSIPLYILAGFDRTESQSDEAAMKYFLLGSFASAIFVFGMALIFTVNGETSIATAIQGLRATTGDSYYLLAIGLSMITVGLAFKVALVPFHMWAPDVYQGSPTSVTAFMAVVAKAAGFGALIRIGATSFGGSWTDALWVLAAASMIIGNVLAISQQNIKRLLAYSGIAHAGYLLMGLLPGTPAGINAALYYLIIYSAMTFGAFTVAILIAGKGDLLENINDYRGAARKNPVLGFMMIVFMMSLAGIPPFAGFFGKLFVFMSAIEGGYVGLTIIAIVTSVISVYYYLRVLVMMWFNEPRPESAVNTSINPGLVYKAVLAGLTAFVLGMSIFAEPILKMTQEGAEAADKTLVMEYNQLREDVRSKPLNPKVAGQITR